MVAYTNRRPWARRNVRRAMAFTRQHDGSYHSGCGRFSIHRMQDEGQRPFWVLRDGATDVEMDFDLVNEAREYAAQLAQA